MAFFGVMKRIAACLMAAAGAVAHADDAGWAALARPGAIVLFRHATAPGVGDPPGMKLSECASQRNLDERGRGEARELGKRFRERGIQVGGVLHSQWCRAEETARLAFGASAPRAEPAFNSFFGGQGEGDAQTRQSLEILRRWKGPGALVVVTHQVNITQLTGLAPASGEGVVVRMRDGAPLAVLGRVVP